MGPRGNSDPPRATFIGDAWENPSHITLTLTLCTRRLLPNEYPEDRAALAEQLAKKKVKGARGAALDAKGVFAMSIRLIGVRRKN